MKTSVGNVTPFRGLRKKDLKNSCQMINNVIDLIRYAICIILKSTYTSKLQ